MKIEKVTYEDLTDLLKSRTTYIKADYIIKAIPEIKNSGYLREMVNTLRVKGNPVVSSSDGYKWSTDKEEIRKMKLIYI